MKFTISSIIFAGLAAAQVILTNSDFSGIEAGEPFTITWADASGPVTLTLMNGPADNLNTVSEITSGETGESFTWTPPESLPSDTYAFEISDGSSINYSQRFEISGGAASGSSTVSLTTATASATSAASTSVVTSTASSTTISTATTESSSSATMSSDSSSITGSVTTSSATTTMTTTMTSSRNSAATTSDTPVVTEVPGTNGAQGVVAPLVAPFLVAVGAALF
ncbi:hypothetical protein DL764_010734 [Monosporascus ibericus]|uniref:Yeast cell wall synthesis Kre9/Knh1-like N-terminal domain-containing protein n=1 Tax=Monosporascus ibericus TaxID=155417 RepID=A0A4Q4SSA5_9PEZI|nr:hypothetical protein DL764_010734 [Monosporascus ibericus]